jgi:hypothetical protein
MWDTEPYEMAEEVVARFDVTLDYALELVQRAIEEELAVEKSMYGEDEWLRDWDGDALASAGFGTDEDYF